ncbi:nitrogenase component 1 [Mesosutterella sp. OilRF-GAM-744-9]|uniref:Nitrogenase component 1 n=1 Tax=Mesosutterella porci TaxID=2915351 RepID=A0ABS9MS90_9BURK|nr:nitrogenase component 1 [Mesosutterella sp. oilRF-744-WT-GAM-9]MCG5031480.1 nitrogenase component 1 [Mesosutterella sp. oilRF-744-WT-GAM-9]
MKQANAFLPVYAADNSSMCSALYELGGLLVMHDASGCNSTYSTHDEPRWYDTPSMVYISGLTEVDAVLGNEQRLIGDVAAAARDYRPKFIALAGTPIPMMCGCDYEGIAREIEQRTGIPSFGIDTNGTKDYVEGAGKAFWHLADRFCLKGPGGGSGTRPRVNILGLTPLDFEYRHTAGDMREELEQEGFEVLSAWAMGSSLEEIERSGGADANLVVSGCGLPAARLLQRRFGTPFVVGAPVGRFMTELVCRKLRAAASGGGSANLACGVRDNIGEDEAPSYVVGEPVVSAAIRASLVRDHGLKNVRVLTSLTCDPALLGPGDAAGCSEDDYLRQLPHAALIVADPVYRMASRGGSPRFIDLPHQAFSGRIWLDAIPRITAARFDQWFDAAEGREPLLPGPIP